MDDEKFADFNTEELDNVLEVCYIFFFLSFYHNEQLSVNMTSHTKCTNRIQMITIKLIYKKK